MPKEINVSIIDDDAIAECMRAGKYIHCKIRREAVVLLEYLTNKGTMWISSGTPNRCLNYRRYRKYTCYKVSASGMYLSYGELDDLQSRNFSIVEFNEILK